MRKQVLPLFLQVFVLWFAPMPTYSTTGIPFSERILELGLDMVEHDWSNDVYVSIPEPQCAYVNITGTMRMPKYKGDTLHCWMEVYDGEGNYFRKRVILDAQGNSSMMFSKRNVKVDFCDDEWGDANTPTIAIGNWVEQDGFHLKAYYNDYFRGVAVTGYRLYELMASDIGRAWVRSGGLAKEEPLALCHPDGFPCAVYLNGDFYGIYSWQLKKHRANMAQRKNEPRHIHLDGTISNATFWNGNIDWTAFEVRNPKEMSEETKECIVSLSQVCGELQQMSAERRSVSEIRAEFARRFDVQTLLDYICLSFLIANFDGFAKNWQWFTYDGVKWFVAPYDLDCTFGNTVKGEVLFPAERTGVDPYTAIYTEGPVYWIYLYFMDQVKERYCQLRRDGVVGSEVVKDLVRNWYHRIGEQNYAEEWNRWPDSKCIHESQYSWCWKPVDKWYHYHKLPDWDPSADYKKGDICRLDKCEWEATADNKGVKPYISLGYVDSIERIEEWVDLRFGFIDSYLGYVVDVGFGKYGQFYMEEGFSERWSNEPAAIHNIQGLKVENTQSGVLYIRDGKKYIRRR
ncbi:MAG: CotH kinase family protein [Prevotella sp.]|nr:CotH kinase family protein [Prevotella sp.]